jgi:hypothetical protein
LLYPNCVVDVIAENKMIIHGIHVLAIEENLNIKGQEGLVTLLVNTENGISLLKAAEKGSIKFNKHNIDNSRYILQSRAKK